MKEVLSSRYRSELEMVAKAVCKGLEIDYDKFKRLDRHKNIVIAKKYYVYIARELFPNIPFPQIAALLNQDHATAIHHYNTIVTGMKVYDEDRDAINHIINSVERFDMANRSKALMTLEHAYNIDMNTFKWTPPQTK